MKTKLLRILCLVAVAFLAITPLLPSQPTPESEQVAARWQPNDPKPGHTG